MGRRLEHHTLAAKRRMNAMNIRHLKVNGRAALRLLSRRHDPDQEPDSAAIEEGHLGRRCEEKGQAQCIPVEGDSFFEVLDRYQQLSDPCIRKIHLLSPGSPSLRPLFRWSSFAWVVSGVDVRQNKRTHPVNLD